MKRVLIIILLVIFLSSCTSISSTKMNNTEPKIVTNNTTTTKALNNTTTSSKSISDKLYTYQGSSCAVPNGTPRFASIEYNSFVPRSNPILTINYSMGEEYERNGTLNRGPNYDMYGDESYPTVIFFDQRNMHSVSSNKVLINNSEDIYKYNFTIDEMRLMDVSNEYIPFIHNEIDRIDLKLVKSVNIDFSRLEIGDFGCINYYPGWQYTKETYPSLTIHDKEEFRYVGAMVYYSIYYYVNDDGVYFGLSLENIDDEINDSDEIFRIVQTNCINSSDYKKPLECYSAFDMTSLVFENQEYMFASFNSNSQIKVDFSIVSESFSDFKIEINTSNGVNCSQDIIPYTNKDTVNTLYFSVDDSLETGEITFDVYSLNDSESSLLCRRKIYVWHENNINYIIYTSLNDLKYFVKSVEEFITTKARNNEDITTKNTDTDDISYIPKYYVRGYVKWQDAFNNSLLHNAKNVTIELWEKENNSSFLIGSTLTSSNGYYSFEIPCTNSTIDIFIKIKTIGANVKVTNILGTVQEYVSSTVYGVSQNQVVTISYTGNVSDLSLFNEYLSIHQALEVGSRLVYQYEGSYIDEVQIRYPNFSVTSYASYLNDIITLNSNFAYAWDCIQHEFGHHIASKFNCYASLTTPIVAHCFDENLIDATLNKKDGISAAWSEGLASFFMLLIQKEMQTSQLGISYVGDSNYDIYNPNGYESYPLELLPDSYKKGEGCEAAICGSLYDLIDGLNTLDSDGVCISHEIVWDMIVQNECKNFSDFMALFMNSSDITDLEKIQFASTLTNHNISPLLSLTIDYSSIMPTIEWSPQGGSLICPNNLFILSFYDEDYSLIFSTSLITISSYTLSQSQFNLLNDSVVYCSIEALQVNESTYGEYILTGPYHSKYIQYSFD